MKMLAAIIAVPFLATAGLAEEAKPPEGVQLPPVTVTAPPVAPAASALVAPKVYYLEVSSEDLNLLAQAINEIPKKLADPLLLKLNGQLQVQEKMAAKASAQK